MTSKADWKRWVAIRAHMQVCLCEIFAVIAGIKRVNEEFISNLCIIQRAHLRTTTLTVLRTAVSLSPTGLSNNKTRTTFYRRQIHSNGTRLLYFGSLMQIWFGYWECCKIGAKSPKDHNCWLNITSTFKLIRYAWWRSHCEEAIIPFCSHADYKVHCSHLINSNFRRCNMVAAISNAKYAENGWKLK